MKHSKSIFFCLSLVLIIFTAFRDGEKVSDYSEYIWMFENIDQISTEITFVLITRFVWEFLNGEVIYLFIFYAILGVGLKMMAISRLSNLVFLSLLVYISYFFILHEMTQIRVGVAAGLFLLSIIPLYERRFWSFFLLIGTAYLFHRSSLVLFLLWFLNKDKIHKKFYVLLIPISYLFYLSGMDLLPIVKYIPISAIQQKIEGYQILMVSDPSKFGEISVFNTVHLLRCLLAFFLLWKAELLIKYNKYAFLLIKIYIVALFSFVFFSFIPTLGARISELFMVTEIILIPLIYYVFRPRFLSRCLVVLYCLAIFLILVWYNPIIK